jgi:hypothetical protein
MASRLNLGAPGIYHLPEEPLRALTGARMDVCAFVGVAPRGPARPPRFETAWAQRPTDERSTAFPRSLAVPVESFDAYQRLYGGFEGPGLLPYAVASFFEQGGRRAYVVRIVHAYTRDEGGSAVPDDDANAGRVATGTLTGTSGALLSAGGDPIELRARDEGAWGNGLTARLSFETAPLDSRYVGPTEIAVDRDQDMPTGSLLRFHFADGTRVLRFVTLQRQEWAPDEPTVRRVATLSAALAAEPDQSELVTGVLDLDDGDGRRERHGPLGLSGEHPRWLAQVLAEDSLMVYPTEPWADDALDLTDDALPVFETGAFEGGEDDYAAIVPEDFFDDAWVDLENGPGAGVHAVIGLPDLAQVVVPDLYSPQPLVPTDAVLDPGPAAGPEFCPCPAPAPPAEQTEVAADLEGLRLDPTDATDLETITGLQVRLAELADELQSFIVLLDVPPGLHQRQILRWRQRFGTAYAAAYHPWLKVSRADDDRDALIEVNPAAAAAGIIAARELRLGIPHGPANVIAAGVVDLDEPVPPGRHDELHQNAINVYRMARDGVELTAARTLARDQSWRQLSVRRLITMLRRVLEQQMQWAAFEPHNAALRADIRRLLLNYLRQLYRANAFRGATEEQAFFVKCDEELNPPASVDQGLLLAHVGVAPAEPLEFIVLTLARGGDGTLRVED